jgi:hypothetical protein
VRFFFRCACRAKNGMARCWLRMEALGTSRCVSAWVRWSCRGTQRCQKAWHGSPHVREGQNRAARLPGSRDSWEQRACQDQVVLSTRDDLRPPVRVGWSAQTRRLPEHDLRVQPGAMLMRGTPPRGRADLSQRHGVVFLAFPDTPPHRGITPPLTCPMADDRDHADLHPTRGTQMHLVPALDVHARAVSICALPPCIRFSMGARIAALKTRSIRAEGRDEKPEEGRTANRCIGQTTVTPPHHSQMVRTARVLGECPAHT